MNEELKIIIKAVTDSAQKAIKEVSGELNGLSKSAKSSSGKVGAAMKGIAKGAAIAVAAIAAVGAAIVALGKKSLEFTREHAKLVASFQAVGASAQHAESTYKGLYRFLGDSGKATEAASHLALIATNQEQLAEWTRISQGVYARFGDSLPIEGLTEAANETLKVGKVTGTLADALNWAGVSEDEFNAKLAATSTYEEREALLRKTLNNLYGEAADIYEKNNKALLDYNESQARLDQTMAEAGAVVTPLLTALNNLGSTLFSILKPALDAIIPPITAFVNWISQAIQSVASFFSILTGKTTTVTATAKSIGSAADSAQNLGQGMGQVEDAANGAAQAAEQARKAVMGFDELNIVSSGTSSSGAGSSSKPTTPNYATNSGFLDDKVFTAEAEQVESSAFTLAQSIKDMFSEIATLFQPSVEAWSAGFETIKESWNNAKPDLINGLNEYKEGFYTLGSYLLTEFVPNIVNSFSTNLAPVFSEIFGFLIEEGAKNFEWFGEKFNQVVNDIIIPLYQEYEKVATDVFTSIGNAWEEHGEGLLNGISGVFENIRGHLDNFYNTVILPIWNALVAKFDEVWTQGLKPLIDEVIETVLEIGTDLTTLYNEVLAPIVDWFITNVGPKIVERFEYIISIVGEVLIVIANVCEGIVSALGGLISFITGVFTGDWEKAWEGLKEFFGGIWDAIVAIFQGAWDLIVTIFEPIGEWFQARWEDIQFVFREVKEWLGGKFDEAWQEIQLIFSDPAGYFSEKWREIQAIFEPVAEWFGGIFEDALAWIETAFEPVVTWFEGIWEDIQFVFNGIKGWFKSAFKKGYEGVKEAFSEVVTFFEGLWNSVKLIFTDLGTKIGDAVGGAFKTGFNNIIQFIEDTINDAIDLINGAIGLINKIPGVNIGTVGYVDLPKLAQGGVVTSATTAIIGEAGKEAVLPLENNTEWMDRLADRIAARNKTPSKIVLQIGEKELGWATIGAINGITNQTGKVQLAL